MASKTFKPDECGKTGMLVAPIHEQPVPRGEWPGHTSQKFTTNKAHVPHPEVNN